MIFISLIIWHFKLSFFPSKILFRLLSYLSYVFYVRICPFYYQSPKNTLSKLPKNRKLYLPYMCVDNFNASKADLASVAVDNSTKQKPRCLPVCVLGVLHDLIVPKVENKFRISSAVHWKGTFLTISLQLFDGWTWFLASYRAACVCSFFFDNFISIRCPSSSTPKTSRL